MQFTALIELDQYNQQGSDKISYPLNTSLLGQGSPVSIREQKGNIRYRTGACPSVAVREPSSRVERNQLESRSCPNEQAPPEWPAKRFRPCTRPQRLGGSSAPRFA